MKVTTFWMQGTNLPFSVTVKGPPSSPSQSDVNVPAAAVGPPGWVCNTPMADAHKWFQLNSMKKNDDAVLLIKIIPLDRSTIRVNPWSTNGPIKVVIRAMTP